MKTSQEVSFDSHVIYGKYWKYIDDMDVLVHVMSWGAFLAWVRSTFSIRDFRRNLTGWKWIWCAVWKWVSLWVFVNNINIIVSWNLRENFAIWSCWNKLVVEPDWKGLGLFLYALSLKLPRQQKWIKFSLTFENLEHEIGL